MRSLLWAVTAAIGLANAAAAQGIRPFEKVAVAGQVQRMGYVTSVDPNCRPSALPSVAILQAPRQGRVTFKRGLAFSNYPTTNSRVRCNGRRTNSLEILYQSAVGAFGDDIFAVEFIDQFGNPRRFQYHVSLRPRAG